VKAANEKREKAEVKAKAEKIEREEAEVSDRAEKMRIFEEKEINNARRIESERLKQENLTVISIILEELIDSSF